MHPVQRVAIAVLAGLLLALPAAAERPVTEGELRYTDPGSGEVRAFPLRHTDVVAAVSGTVAEVTVTQQFANPLNTLLEAVYVFPLPDRAAVDDMSIRVGDRLLKGEIHRREEARQIYEQARAAGHLTGLLDQERPNIFTQRVANIRPDEGIEVVIHYVEDLHFDHGTWRFTFPMVVGPRYIPGTATGRSGSGWSPDTDRVPDASRITPPVLTPGERSGHDIALTVELAPGFPISQLASSSHEIVRADHGSTRVTVALASRDRIPNKDFVLSWTTAGPAVESAVLAHRDGRLGYLTLILQPPAQPRDDQVTPREVVFVLDTSGSMSGEPIAACKQLVRKALRGLRDDDTFRLIRFAGAADQLDPAALPATPANLERALSYLDGIRGGGGTEMLTGVRAALEAPKDPYRLRMVVFLTDGYIGNEQEIIRAVSDALGDARVFSFGVGSSVNRYLLDRMAEAGRGVAEYLRPGESPDALVTRFYERISDPVFTQLELDWGGLDVIDQEPARLPDLFAAQPLLVHARYRSAGRGTVTLRGWAGTRRIAVTTRVKLPAREPGNAAQASLWARARIARLEMDSARGGEAGALREQVTALALEHRLMTRYTSFVVVDRSTTRNGDLTTVDQPVPMPEGVSYEGVFGRADKKAGLEARFAPSAARQVKAPIPMVKRVMVADPTPDEALVREEKTEAAELLANGVPPLPRSAAVRGTSEANAPPAPTASGAAPGSVSAPATRRHAGGTWGLAHAQPEDAARERTAAATPPVPLPAAREAAARRPAHGSGRRALPALTVSAPLLGLSLGLLLLAAAAWLVRRALA